MLLKPNPVSSRQFMWTGNSGVAEMSELRGFGRVWNDSCDEGLTVVSHRTGEEVVFAVEHVEVDSEGDIRYWNLKPAQTMNVLVVLTVFND